MRQPLPWSCSGGAGPPPACAWAVTGPLHAGRRQPRPGLIHSELSHGPGSRLLLLAIGADDPALAARLSRQLRGALVGHAAFAAVHNGDFDELAEVAALCCRCVSATAGDGPGAVRRRQPGRCRLGERLHDLGSLDGEAFETLLAHDPHLLTLAMVQSWQPARQPGCAMGSGFPAMAAPCWWCRPAGGFDPQAQAEALAVIDSQFRHCPAPTGTLAISGPAASAPA